jgi:hypothetical protein
MQIQWSTFHLSSMHCSTLWESLVHFFSFLRLLEEERAIGYLMEPVCVSIKQLSLEFPADHPFFSCSQSFMVLLLSSHCKRFSQVSSVKPCCQESRSALLPSFPPVQALFSSQPPAHHRLPTRSTLEMAFYSPFAILPVPMQSWPLLSWAS